MNNDFSSLDKLVEFGLGMGVATQMMNTMNSVLAQTAVPGVGINPGVKKEQQTANLHADPQYYILYQENTSGPFVADEINQLIKKGIINEDTFIWKVGTSSWNRAAAIPEINKLLLLSK